MRDTILHEVAHALTPGDNHGPLWRRVCRQIGARPERCYTNDAVIQRGNLLTLPVGGGLLYVQPVYIKRQAAEGTYPVLQFVAASFGKDVGFGQTLDEALRVALKLESADTTPDDDAGDDSGGDTDGGGDEEAPAAGKTPSQYLEDASARYNEAQDALKAGNLAEYQSKIEEMSNLLEQAQNALE